MGIIFYLDLFPLDKSKIFAFIFLTGMLFTVFNYFAYAEEETKHKKVELAKKNCDEDSSGDSEDDPDDDLLGSSVFFCFSGLPANQRAYVNSNRVCSDPTPDISSPPPRF